jgi:hypothetical protein
LDQTSCLGDLQTRVWWLDLDALDWKEESCRDRPAFGPSRHTVSHTRCQAKGHEYQCTRWDSWEGEGEGEGEHLLGSGVELLNSTISRSGEAARSARSGLIKCTPRCTVSPLLAAELLFMGPEKFRAICVGVTLLRPTLSWPIVNSPRCCDARMPSAILEPRTGFSCHPQVVQALASSNVSFHAAWLHALCFETPHRACPTICSRGS